MAKNKRHPMTIELNDIDPKDVDLMTDQEFKTIQQKSLKDEQQSEEPKKAM